METKELYYPQISAQAGSYTFEEGVELEIYSSKSSYYDWAKIRFTSQFRPKLSLKKKDPATIQLGYDGTLEDVFTGFVSGNYDGGTYANEVALKDEMLLMEETIINDTFLDTTPQELISYFLAQAGLSKMKLSSKTYPTRKMLPIRRQTAVQAINAVNAAWGLRVPFFFSGGGNPFPRAGTFAASEEFYHFGAYTIYQGFASDIEVGSKAAQGAKVYLRCSTSTRCSTNAKGGAAE